MAAYFVIKTPPLERKHVSWTVHRNFNNSQEYIRLGEVVYNYYAHPDAPEYAKVQVLEEEFICEFLVNSEQAAPLLVLEAALKTIGVVNSQIPEYQSKNGIKCRG